MATKLEYLVAFTAIIWGAWLLNPFADTFGSGQVAARKATAILSMVGFMMIATLCSVGN